MKFLRDIIEGLAFGISYILANILPKSVSYKLSYITGIILYFLLRKRRSLGEDKFLPIAGDIRRTHWIIRNILINFCKNIVDFCRMHRLTKSKLNDYIDSIEGLENLDNALKLGKGVLLIGPHLGNIELAGAALSILGYPMSAVVWRNPNRFIKDKLLSQRKKVGLKPIEFKGSEWFKEAIKDLSNNRIVALLCDVDGGEKGVKLEFASKLRSFSRAMVLLAMKSKAQIVPAFNLRVKKKNKLKGFILEPYKLRLTQDKEKDIYENTKNIVTIFEPYILKNPEQWL